MKVLGIISEYNPFHNGHLYHLKQSKKISNTDYAICVMSGNFIQRGEPALVNKWSRAEMALLSGIDLVLELPVVYSLSSAEFFASGAVKILDSLGIVDYLCFGSESGNIDELRLIAEILVNEPEAYKLHLKEQLDIGASFPSARESALKSYFDNLGIGCKNIHETISLSNNILGIEYLKASIKLGSRIKPITLKRVSNSYNSEELSGSISSATAIRKCICSSKSADCIDFPDGTIPKASISILDREFQSGRGPVFPGAYENIILAALRSMTTGQISRLPYISEGLENRIKEAASASVTLDSLIENISTKRYARTRIQRCLFSLLNGITAGDFETFNRYGGPQYIRVLGFNKKGQNILAAIKKAATLPVITKPANFKNSCNPLLKRMLEIEARATDIYVLGYANPAFRAGGQEYTSNVVII